MVEKAVNFCETGFPFWRARASATFAMVLLHSAWFAYYIVRITASGIPLFPWEILIPALLSLLVWPLVN